MLTRFVRWAPSLCEHIANVLDHDTGLLENGEFDGAEFVGRGTGDCVVQTPRTGAGDEQEVARTGHMREADARFGLAGHDAPLIDRFRGHGVR